MKKITAKGIKENNKPFMVVHANVLRHNLDALPKGTYTMTIEKYCRKASHQQFKYLYGVVYPLSLIALNDAGYEFINVDQVDLFWKSIFASKEILNRDTGEIMKIPLSKSEFKTIDEMVYCDSIRNYCSEYFNIWIPDPDPNYKQNKKL